MKPILLLILVASLFSGCSNRLRNRVDPNVVECGLTEAQAAGKRLIRPDFLMVREQVQLFDGSGNAVVEFEVTEKNCLLLAKGSPAVAMVYGNSVAGWLGDGKVEFKSCGADCGVFPACGYFEASDASVPWMYIKVDEDRDRSQNVSAIVETESGPQSVRTSSTGCLKVDGTLSGVLSVTDAAGNFLERDLKTVRDLSQRIGQVFVLSLRPPLDEQEKFCKKNEATYKLEGGVCIPKDVRDYCQELMAQVGRKQLIGYLGTADCQRIWKGFQNAKELGFGAKGILSPKFFSNLPKLKTLNLSGNPEIGSFAALKNVSSLEELIVTHANFNIAEVLYFPKVTALTIGNINDKWKDSPELKQIKRLTLSGDESDDFEFLSKFPDLEDFTFLAGVGGTYSLKGLRNARSLKKMNLPSFCVYDCFVPRDVPGLESLETLKASNLDAFSGPYPKLKSLSVESLSDLQVLAQSPALESLSLLDASKIVNSPIILSSVKSLSIKGLQHLRELEKFPNVETLSVEVQMDSRSPDLEPLRNLKNLKYLDLIILGGGDLHIRRIDFPNLISLSISREYCEIEELVAPMLDSFTSTCMLNGKFDAPKLQTMSTGIRGKNVDFAVLPALTSLYIKSEIPDFTFLDNKVPNLRELSFPISPEIDMSHIPRHIETLDFWDLGSPDWGPGGSLDFIYELHNLKNLKVHLQRTWSFSRIDEVIVLDSMSLYILDPKWDEFPKFKLTGYYRIDGTRSGDLERLHLKNIDMESIKTIESMSYDGDVDPEVWPEVKFNPETLKVDNLDALNSLVRHSPGTFTRTRKISISFMDAALFTFNPAEKFPNLESIEIDALTFRTDLNIAMETWFNFFIAKFFSIKRVYFKEMSDPDWYSCNEKLPSSIEGLREQVCAAIEATDVGYRPSHGGPMSGMGWDYE